MESGQAGERPIRVVGLSQVSGQDWDELFEVRAGTKRALPFAGQYDNSNTIVRFKLVPQVRQSLEVGQEQCVETFRIRDSDGGGMAFRCSMDRHEHFAFKYQSRVPAA